VRLLPTMTWAAHYLAFVLFDNERQVNLVTGYSLGVSTIVAQAHIVNGSARIMESSAALNLVEMP
jgi:hypothetical protein